MDDNWQIGDQAMCIKGFIGSRVYPSLPADRADPMPPSIYLVTGIMPPPPPPDGFVWGNPPPCFLKLQGKRYAYDCRFFRKVPPMAPEEVDDIAREPVLA